MTGCETDLSYLVKMSELFRILADIDNDEDENNGPGFGCTSQAFSRTMNNHVTNTNNLTENFRLSNILLLTNSLFSMF